MVVIAGFGWISEDRYGCAGERFQRHCPDAGSLYSGLRDDGVLPRSIKNFGRFNPASKLVCGVVGLGLRDGLIELSESNRTRIGMTVSGYSGCLSSNLGYFRDYVGNGRALGRGNLFIYTLPSSPLAEAGICFGLKGPALYMGFEGNQNPSLLRHSATLLESTGSLAILAAALDDNTASCFVLMRRSAAPPRTICTLAEAVEASGAKSDPLSTLRALMDVGGF